jgi:hypothetical protein
MLLSIKYNLLLTKPATTSATDTVATTAKE